MTKQKLSLRINNHNIQNIFTNSGSLHYDIIRKNFRQNKNKIIDNKIDGYK